MNTMIGLLRPLLILTSALVAEPMAQPMPTAVLDGWLSAYAQTPTDATLAIRQEWGQLPADVTAYDGYVAVLDCAMVGQDATLHTAVGSFDVLIFDCAGQADGGYDWMVDGRFVAEIDWYLWEAYPELPGTWATLEVYD